MERLNLEQLELCCKCKYFIESSKFSGMCFRYPNTVRKQPTEFCGEFKLENQNG